MTHYEVLGVGPSATAHEVRQAYLRLARDHHPDRHAGASDAERAAAEARMRELNEAWHVLGDRERRRIYDATLARRPRASVVEPEQGDWRPFDVDGDEPDDRLDDSHRPPPRGGRLLGVLPPVVVAGGVLAFVVGLALGWRGLIALGASMLISGLAFVVLASLVVMFESRRNDLGPGTHEH